MPLERGQPVRAIVFHERVGDELHKLGTMRDARSIGIETRVGRKLGPFEDFLRKYAELQITVKCKDDDVCAAKM